MRLNYTISSGDFVNAGKASSEIKKVLKQLGISAASIKRIVVALYEAEVNVVAHATEGNIIAMVGANEISIVIADKGPGIEDIDQAMKEGYSTASREVREMGFGAGMGLANIKRNADRFHISSAVGVGTRVEITNKLA